MLVLVVLALLLAVVAGLVWIQGWLLWRVCPTEALTEATPLLDEEIEMHDDLYMHVMC